VDNQGTEKRVVRVTIFQQPYSLRASGDPAETEAIAHGVDDLMNQIADRSGSGDPSRVAVLAALHLADKVRALEVRAQSLDERVGDIQQRLQDSTQRAEKAEKALEELKRVAHDEQSKSVQRAEKAEKALEELKRVAHDEQSKSAQAINQRESGLYERLAAMDARLANMLDNPSR
jgi:cell division protein ZapA (FtsZ GTPase activity inhibitor)